MKRRTVFLSMVGALLLTVGGVAVYAAIPDSLGVIHGCYDKAGALRVVDPPTPPGCTAKERAVNWNQTGPQGPAGPAGPQGAPGVSGYQIVTASGAAPGVHEVDVFCPPGKRVLGGGAATHPGTVYGIAKSHPIGDTGWRAAVSSNDLSAGIDVYAICAYVQP